VHRASTIRYSYTDLLSIPEDHQRHEIVDGELCVTPTPRVIHQYVAANPTFLLRSFADPLGLGMTVGPITVRLEEELVLEPDLVFVRQDRMSIVDPEGHVHAPPDLVVEILSPSRKSYDRTLKRKRYLESGVGEVWIIDIDERLVEVWRPESQRPEEVREVLLWRVDDHVFEIPLVEVFRVL
jgi:Uma2 family endonuclease